METTLEQPLEEEKPSIIKKIVVIVIAIFLITLILSLSLLSSSSYNQILSLFIGSRLDNSTLHIDQATKLIFNDESLTNLNNLYNSNLEREFKVCLNGKKIDNTYFITETLQPRTFEQEYNRVVAEPCPKESLVDLHTHPFKDCIPSQQDIKVFADFKKGNSDALLAVMCDKDLFLFYK